MSDEPQGIDQQNVTEPVNSQNNSPQIDVSNNDTSPMVGNNVSDGSVANTLDTTTGSTTPVTPAENNNFGAVNTQTQPVQEAPQAFTLFAPTSDIQQPQQQDVDQPIQPSANPFGVAPQPVSPVYSTPNMQPQTNMGAATKPKWWKTKKFIIAAVASVIALFLIGGSAFAYTSYQDPKKVLADSIINAVIAKKSIYAGTLEFNSVSKSEYSDTEQKVKAIVEFNSKFADAGQQDHNAKLTVEYQEKKYSVEGDALFDKAGDIYFKVKGLKAIAGEMKNSLGINDSTVAAAIDKFISRIDDVWVKVSTEDLKEFDDNYSKTKECVNKAIDEFRDDRDAILEVTNLYRQNPYLAIEKDLGVAEGNFVYEVTNDVKAGQEFLKGLRDTKIYKSLNKCDNSFEISDDYIDSLDDSNNKSSNIKEESTYKLSINMWSHQIAKFEGDYKITDNSYGTSTYSSKITLTPDYNTYVTVSAPAKTIGLKQLKTYIDELSQAISNYYSSQYDNYNYEDYSY